MWNLQISSNVAMRSGSVHLLRDYRSYFEGNLQGFRNQRAHHLGLCRYVDFYGCGRPRGVSTYPVFTVSMASQISGCDRKAAAVMAKRGASIWNGWDIV